MVGILVVKLLNHSADFFNSLLLNNWPTLLSNSSNPYYENNCLEKDGRNIGCQTATALSSDFSDICLTILQISSTLYY